MPPSPQRPLVSPKLPPFSNRPYPPTASRTNAPSPVALPIPQPQPAQAYQRTSALVLGIVIAELFILVTRTFDVVLSGYRIPMVVFLALGLSALLSRSFFPALRERLTISVLVFFAWCCVTTILSTWRRNSIDEVENILYGVVLFTALGCLLNTTQAIDKIFAAIAWFTAYLGPFALYFGTKGVPRLAIGHGTYGDPNQLALSLVTGLPFCWYVIHTRTGLTRAVMFLAQFPIIWAFLKTSSRGGMVALFISCFVLWWGVSPAKKVIVGSLILLAGVSFLQFAPAYMKVRFTTIFSSGSAEVSAMEQMGEEEFQALGLSSGESRLQLLKDSLMITAKYPIFGVGLRNFGNERWSHYKALTGLNIPAQTTHNTFTQLSAETGIPGLILYLAIIGFSLVENRRIRKLRSANGFTVPRQLQVASYYLFLAMIATVCGTFFLSGGYFQTLTFAGLAVAIIRLVDSQRQSFAFARRKQASLAPLPA